MTGDKVKNQAIIKVTGVGGCGCNSLTRMCEAGLHGVELIAINTDLQALDICKCDLKLQIGTKLTKGLGAGARPEIGQQAAEENREDIINSLEGADMIFITAGMGGGTGTGAAPVIAEMSKNTGSLTVGIVTKPFAFELKQKKILAEQGIERLRANVDTLIVIENDKLLQVMDKKVTLKEAFRYADEVLRQAVEAISSIILQPGLINVDFSDIKTVMTKAGTSWLGIGTGKGDNRALDAAKAAISSPLLATNMNGAKGVIFIISGPENLTLHELNSAATLISQAASQDDANVIFGNYYDESLGEDCKITVIATGFDSQDDMNNILPLKKKSHSTFETYEITLPKFLEDLNHSR